LHKKQSGGAGQYAKVIGYVEPIEEDGDAEQPCQFENHTQGTNVPHEYIPSIEKAFME